MAKKPAKKKKKAPAIPRKKNKRRDVIAENRKRRKAGQPLIDVPPPRAYRRARIVYVIPTCLRNREDWIPLFLTEYAKHGNRAKAAAYVGRARNTISTFMRKDQEFAEAMQACDNALIDLVEESVIDHAVDGFEEPVFHEGKVCGHKMRFSSAERMLLLKKRKREVYGDDEFDVSNDPMEAAREAMEQIKLMDDEGFIPAAPGDDDE